MSNLRNVVYLSDAQYETLLTGGSISGYGTLNADDLYLTPGSNLVEGPATSIATGIATFADTAGNLLSSPSATVTSGGLISATSFRTALGDVTNPTYTFSTASTTGLYYEGGALKATVGGIEQLGLYADKVYIAQKVGIGIATPQFTLSTNNNGTIATTTLRLQDSYLDSGSFGIQLKGVDNGVNGHDLKIQGRTSASGSFVDLVTVKNAGNIGIGTTSPDDTLTIVKTNTGGMGASLALVNAGTSGTAGSSASIDFGLENSTYADVLGNAQIKAVLEGANNSSSLVFSTYNGTAFAERARIFGSGTVRLASLASVGFVKSNASGDLSVDTNTYLTANQSITLSGDISGTGATAITTTIGDGKVTLAKMANLAANSIIGNNTASPATPIALTKAQVLALLNVADGAQVNVPTNLSWTAGTTSGPTVVSSTGDDAVIPSASATASGAVTTGAQSFAGLKTFNDALAVGSVAQTWVIDGSGTSLLLQSGSTPTTRFSVSNVGEITIPALAGTAGVLDVDVNGKIILHSGSFATSVTLNTGATNGTLNLTVNGVTGSDVAVKGFGQSFTSTETSRALLSDNTNAYITLPRQIPAVTLNGSSNNSPSFYAPTTQLSAQSSTNSYLVGASSTTSLSTVYSNASVYMSGATLYATTFSGALTGHASLDLPLTGGTLSGQLITQADQYTDDRTTSAINLRNSNIIGANSIYFADLADNSTEGIHFYRDATHADSLWAYNGVLNFTPNRTIGSTATDYTVYHSGNLTGTITSHAHTLANVTGAGTTTLTGVTTSAYNMGTTSATTTKATMQYNATTQSVEFIFA